MERDEIIAALRKVPGFAADADGLQIDPLGGLTNRVFRVHGPGDPVVLHLPGAGTEAYIDREV